MSDGSRAARRALALALVSSLAITGACTSDREPAAAPSEAVLNHLSPACPALPSPLPARSERQLAGAAAANVIVSLADLPGWQAGDIGASAELADGRHVWVFGDTVRTESYSPRIVANSMLISARYCISQVVTPEAGPVIPDARSGIVYWPMSVAVLNDGPAQLLVVLCSRIRRGDGAFGFTFLGTSAAVFAVADGETPQLLGVDEITPDDPDLYQINWGAASTVHKSWLYVYGTRLTEVEGMFGRELYVARAPLTDPGNRDRWRFWDGVQWQRDKGRATAILPAAGGVSQTLSVHAVGDQFIAVSKRDGDLSEFVYTWSSPNPTGPWIPRQAVKAPAGFDTGKLKYAPLAHPEIRLDSGNLLVSISRNTTDLGALLSDPGVGRPLFVEVPLPR